MQATPIIKCVEELSVESRANPKTVMIRCYSHSLSGAVPEITLPPARELVVEAMTLFMRIENELREVRAEWNLDRLRRLMRLRPKVVARLRRRWERLNPLPRIPLGSLRRRYHANLAGYLSPVVQD
jgi:hypothetical protein